MVCYPCVFDWAGETWMLYNGNGYGRTGFGLARRVVERPDRGHAQVASLELDAYLDGVDIDGVAAVGCRCSGVGS